MNRYRTLPGLGPQKASSTTVCQKCLKKDIYECKASVQERPYAARPSRTQQLLNPKTVPKLANVAMNEELNTKQVTAQHDHQLAASGQEQGDGNRGPILSASRARSRASISSESVSSISTNQSQSRSSSRDRRPRHSTDRNHRESLRTPSPSDSHARKRKRRSASTQESESPPPAPNSQRKYRRHRTISPDDRGRPSVDRRGSHRSRSGSWSDNDRHSTRHRRSLDKKHSSRDTESGTRERAPGSNQPDGSGEHQPRTTSTSASHQRTHNQKPRERSLSPYSRRLALTQAMNMSR